MTAEQLPATRVLCALDVKSAPRGPLAMASALAERLSASLDGLHAVAPNVSWRNRAERVKGLIVEHNARERLEALLAPFASSLEVESFVTRGPTSEVILAHAREHEADLIVLGADQSGFGTRAVNRVVPSVVAGADCAVLTVPGDSPACAMRRILMPVTAAGMHSTAVNWAITLATRFGAQVTVVHVQQSRRGFWSVLTGQGTSEPLPSQERLDQAVEATVARLRRGRVASSELGAHARNVSEVVELSRSLAYDAVIVGVPAASADSGVEQELLFRLRRESSVPTLSCRELGARPRAASRRVEVACRSDLRVSA